MSPAYRHASRVKSRDEKGLAVDPFRVWDLSRVMFGQRYSGEVMSVCHVCVLGEIEQIVVLVQLHPCFSLDVGFKHAGEHYQISDPEDTGRADCAGDKVRCIWRSVLCQDIYFGKGLVYRC